MRALAIDKTGTLTAGALVVVDFRADGREPLRLLQQVASLETRSEHPVGEAIVRHAAEQGMRLDAVVDGFAALPGRGVKGRVGSVDLVVGTEALVGEQLVARWGAAEPGTLRIYAAAADGGEGAITLQDEIRPDAAAVVKQLHAMAVRPIVMLTGDSAPAAEAVARALGVDAVRWRLLPQEKVEAVCELRTPYGTVAMLGDGVNDAPALAAATVGLVMGAASSPATIETADVALMADDLRKLPYTVHLARRARRIIRFNIALALGAKLVLAAGAVLGVVSLAVAVLVGDMGGSLLVTVNALRLARTRG